LLKGVLSDFMGQLRHKDDHIFWRRPPIHQIAWNGFPSKMVSGAILERDDYTIRQSPPPDSGG
jgi:hypothetical protein